MKEMWFNILSLILMCLMVVLTTMQSNTVIWLLFAVVTFFVIHLAAKWARITGNIFPGLQSHQGWQKYLVIGILVGSTYSTVRFLVLFKTGALKIIEIFPVTVNALTIPIIILLISMCYISFAEELIFRGYVLNALPDFLNKKVTIGISACLFLLGHSLNGIASVSRIIELLFIGFTFGMIYIETKSLWPVIGLHFGWDFVWSLLGGDGQVSTPYILSVEQTSRYTKLMNMTDSIMPVILFLAVLVLKRFLSKSSSADVSETI